MKTLGILGGMGPSASQLLYEKIVRSTQATCDQEHLDLILYSHASLMDRTTAIQEGRVEEMTALLSKDCLKLQQWGAECVAIPCNTSHFFLDQVKRSVDIPVIDMIEETVAVVAKQGRKKVAILATEGTYGQRLYQNKLERSGVDWVELPCFLQDQVTDLIYNEIKAGLSGNLSQFLELEEYLLGQEVDCIILACTELSVFAQTASLSKSLYIDALDVLTTACILQCGARLKEHPVG